MEIRTYFLAGLDANIRGFIAGPGVSTPSLVRCCCNAFYDRARYNSNELHTSCSLKGLHGRTGCSRSGFHNRAKCSCNALHHSRAG